MEELPFNLSLLLNLFIQIFLVCFYGIKSLKERQNIEAVKNGFTMVSIFMTIFVSIFGYYGLASIFELFGVDIFHGHANIAFALPFFVSVTVGFFSTTAGQTLVGWKKISW